MKTTRVEISYEQHETWRVTNGDNAEATSCPCCGEDARMVRVENLAIAFQTDSMAIYKLIIDGRLHFVETPQKYVLVCLNSFSERSVEDYEKENLVSAKDI
jgi:hypothetical protein